MDLKISGKRALLTGAAGEMAIETAKVLKEEGVTLVLSDLDEDQLQKANETLGGDNATVVADLSSTEGCDELAEKAGDVDIFAHLTGVTGAKGDPLQMADEDWMDALTIDFMSAVRMASRIGPKMADRGWGRIVFITSENAVQPYPDEAVYNAAKAALMNFTKCASLAYGPRGVLINAVSPAFIETDMTDGMMEKRAKEKDCSFDEAVETFLEEERPYLTLKRRGQPEEVAAAIAFLCSERASFVNGANYRVDGGAVGAMNT